MATTTRLLIPRVIHRIWLGENPMPEEFERYGETWREHHPEWEMRLWTDDNLPPSDLLDALEESKRQVSRSILLRYELLRQFGGVYVDTDMECLRSIEPLLDGVSAFAAWESPEVLCGAVVGGVAGHPAWERAVRDQSERMRVGKARMPGYSRSFLTSLMEHFPEVTLFGPEKFYPFGRDDPPRPASELPEAYAIHHWSWLGRGEPAEGPARIEFLEKRAAAARKAKVRHRRRADRAEERLAEARQRAERLESRLAAIEGSLWWRLHPGRLPGRWKNRRSR